MMPIIGNLAVADMLRTDSIDFDDDKLSSIKDILSLNQTELVSTHEKLILVYVNTFTTKLCWSITTKKS